MQGTASSQFNAAGAGGVLLAVLAACVGIGVLIGWAAGSGAIGALLGAVFGIFGGIVAEQYDAEPVHAGIRHFVNLPPWYADVPADRRAHTSELVSFDDLAGARVVIVGGRQSAYEWAALLCDHGTERVDVVHRHPTPEFAKVSWAFVDGYVDQTLAQRGLVARAHPRRAAGHRPGVLGGGPPDPGAVAGPAPGGRRS